MRLVVRGVASLGVVIAALAASEAARPWLRLRELDRANVDADVVASLQRADLRLVAIEAGAGISVPGVSDSLYKRVVSQPCTRVIYTGDRFQWEWQRRIHDMTVAYATAYNQRLLARAGTSRICVQAG